MRLTELSLGNRATVFFAMIAATIGGVIAYNTLPRDAFPDIQIPAIIVSTVYPGAAPEDVENQITDPVERELQGVEGLKKLTSTSQESVSVVTAEFVAGTDIDDALQKVRDRVDRAEADFPEEAEDPVLQEINFSDIPVLQINLSGEVGPVVLKRLAEELQDDLEAIPGVLRANLVGGLEREVQVDVDPARLRLYGLSLDDVIDAVRNENVAIPGGDLGLGDRNYAVRVPGEVVDPEALAGFVIKTRAGSPIFVRDVATVRYGFKERISEARINGEASVALTIQKRTGANVVEVADRAKALVLETQPRWPSGVQVTFLGDLSKEVAMMVSDLENNILSGLVLVVLVLMFAMSLRNALIVGLAVPFSMLLTFIALQVGGITLNNVVLFSLVLAVGMLVDNAIVVVENIYRHTQDGLDPVTAASVGTREVGSAILNSSLTTVAAFSPMFFWPGVVGDFMSFLPLTTSIVLMASLLVALTVNPVMAARFVRASRRRDVPARFDRLGEGITAAYRRSLEWALGHRAVVIGSTLAFFVAVVLLFGAFNRGIEFFPSTEPSQIFVDVELASGTRLERTNEVVRELERRLADTADLEFMAASIGAGSQEEFGAGGASSTHQARLVLDLLDRKDRRVSSFDTMDWVREQVAGITGATITVKRPNEGPPVGAPLALEISGDDFAELGRISARVEATVADIEGLVSLNSDFDLARPELVIDVDRTQAARLGLTTQKIASTVRTAVTGTEASSYRKGGEDDAVDITVRVAADARRTFEHIAQLSVATEDGVLVPLGSIATLRQGSALTSIQHKNRLRVVTVSGDVANPTLAEPVRAAARERLAAVPDLLPTGYKLTFAGQNEEEEDAKRFLAQAFLYALILVLALIVAQFNSLAVPLIIMTSVLMSMVGVLLGLLTAGLPFGIIMTGIGVLSLAGVVVNNAIVLLDYAEQLRREGVTRREAVVLTGVRRLRPVLLTAITTILGLIPLATGVDFNFRTFSFSTGGESSQWWKGMAVAVIFGLGFATFLTLILVPVLYDLLLGWRDRRASRGQAAQRGTA